MKLLALLLRHSWGLVALATLAGAAGGVMTAALIALINARLATPQGPVAVAWAFGGVLVAGSLANLLSRVLLLRLSEEAVFQLRLKLCRQILFAPLQQIESIGLPRLFAVLSEDIPTASNALLLLPTFCINGAIVVGCLVYLGSLSVAVLALMVLFLVLTACVYLLVFDPSAQRHLKAGRLEWDRLVSHFEALTHGNKELKMHWPRREAFFARLLAPTAMALKRISTSGGSVYAAAIALSQALYFVFVGSLLFVLPAVLPLSPEVQSGYVLVALYLSGPITALLDTLPAIRRANVSVEQIEQLGLSLVANEPTDRPAPHSGHWKSVQLQGVSCTYRGDTSEEQFVLGPLDFQLSPGEIVFVIGGNGSGKTTLAKLVCGLYVPESGGAYLDGELVTEHNLGFYREHFSVIFTDFHLFESLLGLAAEQLGEQAERYLEKLQLQNKVRVEDGRFSTLALSQGQRKRLALLVALLEDRPICVFDEWAANQDPLFQQVFYHELLAELKARGKAVLVVSHDDRYYHAADRVVRLEFGRVVQSTQVCQVLQSTHANEAG